MIEVGIIGYGELGKQFENLICNNVQDVKFYYFDDKAFEDGVPNCFLFNDYLNEKFENISFLIALGYKHLETKKQIVDALISNNRVLYTFIHPSSIIDKSASISSGTVVYPNVTIDKNVQIGLSCILNLSVTIAHDTFIDDCTFLAPSVTISGFVSVGKMVFIGCGACIANNIEIKDSAIVGIGSVITCNVEKREIVIGNPQRTIKNIKLI